jgi:hypothetical protein
LDRHLLMVPAIMGLVMSEMPSLACVFEMHLLQMLEFTNTAIGGFPVVLWADIEIYNWDGQTVLFVQGLF